MNIIVNSDRTVEKEYTEKDGSQNENRVTELNFTLPAEYSDFVKKIAFITEDGNFSDYIENDNTYILKNNVTKFREVICFVWLTDSVSNKDFRSKTFSLEFYYNEDPSNYIPSEQEKSQIELLMQRLDELIAEVEALPTLKREIVEELPTENIDEKTIYMVLREDTEPNNIYDEWLYINNQWEKIGSTDVDLSNYYTKPQADNLLAGKQNTINNSNKLNADLVDDTNSTNKFTNANEKNTWNAKYTKPSGGIPKADLSDEVKASLSKADSAVQDISGKEDKSNKVTSIDENSTDEKYPSAKAVYDELVKKDEAIEEVNEKAEKIENTLYTKENIEAENSLTLENTDENLGLKVLEVESNVLEQSILPEEYQQVEYIESTGTQYIDTNYMPTRDDDIILENVTIPRSNTGTLFHAGTGDSQIILLKSTTADFWIRYLSASPAMQFSNLIFTNSIIEMVNGSFYIDNVLIGNFTYHDVVNTTLNLFRHVNDTNYLSAKIGKIIIKNNNSIKHNFIPCYRKSDGEIGLYDAVDDIFYTNQGTGTFLKGNDSPNPNDEIPIEGITGDVTGRVRSENLFVASLTNNGTNIISANCAITLDEDEFVMVATGADARFGDAKSAGSSYSNADGIKIDVDGVAKLYFLLTNTNFNRAYFTAYTDENVSLSYSRIETYSGEYTVPSNASYVVFRFGKFDSVSGTTYRTKVMISKTNITKYTKPATPLTLSLGTKTIYKGDKIVYRNGKWQWAEVWGKYSFTGNENALLQNSNKRIIVSTEYNNMPIIKSITNSNLVYDIYSNILKKTSADDNWDGVEGLSYNFIGNNNEHYLAISINSCTTIEEYRQALKGNKVVYELAETQYTDITDTILLSQLNTLLLLKQYNDTTYIEFDQDVGFTVEIEKSNIAILDDLKSKNALLLADHVDITGTGTDVTLNGTGDLPMEVDVGGNSTQETIAYVDMGEWEQGSIDSSNGLPFDTPDVVRTDFIEVKPNILYTITRSVATNYMNFRFYNSNKGYLGTQQATDMVTTNRSTTNNRMVENVTNMEITINNSNVAYMRMIDNSNDLATVYTITTQQTPSPTYKQDINNVEGDVKVKAENKNLLPYAEDYTETKNGITLTQNKGKFIINGTSTANTTIYLTLIKSYTIKENDYIHLCNSMANSNASFNFYDENNVSLGIGQGINISNKIASLASGIGKEIVKVGFYCNSGASFTNFEFNPMILNNISTNTDFIEHQENTVTFPLQEGQKLMLGDKLEDDGVHHKRGQIALDGTENWQYDSGISACILSESSYSYKKGGNALCSHYKYDSNLNDNNTFSIGSGYFLLVKNGLSPNNFKSYLAQQYENGTPVIVEYELADSALEDNIEPYTPEQQTAYNKLKEMQSYYDLTYVTGSSDNAQPILTAHAKKSLKVMQSEIDELKQAILNS